MREEWAVGFDICFAVSSIVSLLRSFSIRNMNSFSLTKYSIAILFFLPYSIYFSLSNLWTRVRLFGSILSSPSR